MARKSAKNEADPLQQAIAAAGSAAPAKMSKRPGPKRAAVPASPAAKAPRVWNATDLAIELGVDRTTIYNWVNAGLPKSPCGGGFLMRDVLDHREGAAASKAARSSSSVEDELELHQTRKMAAQADMAEDLRDKQRGRLVEVEIVRAVYEDDFAKVAGRLRPLGAKLMNRLALIDDPAAILRILDGEVDAALNELSADHVDPTSDDPHDLVKVD